MLPRPQQGELDSFHYSSSWQGYQKVDVSLYFYLGKEAVILTAAPSTAFNSLAFPQQAAPLWEGQTRYVPWVPLPREWLTETWPDKKRILPERKWMESDRGMKESKAGTKGWRRSETRCLAARFVPKMCPGFWGPLKACPCSGMCKWDDNSDKPGCPFEITGFMVYRKRVWVWFFNGCLYFSGIVVQNLAFSSHWEDAFKDVHLHSSRFDSLFSLGNVQGC